MTLGRYRRSVGTLAVAALLAVTVLLFLVSGAHGAPACTLDGPRWTHYDAHGGAHPKLDAAGTRYYVILMSYPCAQAKAALAKIFPHFPRPPFTPGVTLKGGPAGFFCRSSGGGPPDLIFGGLCANQATHKLFQWLPYDPHAG